MNIFQDDRLWAGTEQALLAYVEETKRFLASGKSADYGDNEEDVPGETPRLFSMQGDIGVITIAGSLVNNDSWINKYVGRTGYPEIRAALIHAASDPAVKTILLDVQSGGGHVAGVSDTADLITTIDKKVKPIHTYSDSMMASAAYWLGSNGRTVSIGKVAEVGSIGVLVVHQENSKMLAEYGITTTVIRSGKYKALGLSSEKLSELGKEVIQAQVDKIDGMFVESVAKARGVTADKVEKDMAGGRVFLGEDAVAAGLVDSVTNFDTLVSKLQAGIDKQRQTGGIAFPKSVPQYAAHIPEGTEVKKPLTEQQIAAIAAGAVSAEQAAAASAAATTETTEIPAAPAAAETTETAETTEAAPAAAAPAAAQPDAVVTLLQQQLATAQAQVVTLSVEATTLKSAAEAAVAQAEKMRPIVRAAVGNLRVALGGASAGIEALTDDLLLAEHANLAAQFTSKFKAGGVAAVSSSAAAETVGETAQDPLRAARLAATRNSK